jgi:hypothetical protein
LFMDGPLLDKVIQSISIFFTLYLTNYTDRFIQRFFIPWPPVQKKKREEILFCSKIP